MGNSHSRIIFSLIIFCSESKYQYLKLTDHETTKLACFLFKSETGKNGINDPTNLINLLIEWGMFYENKMNKQMMQAGSS